MDDQDNELLDVFVQESREHLESFEPDLLTLEKDPKESETINRIFRTVHSLKGAAGFFGLDNIAELSHVMENVMALIREGEMEATKPIINCFLKGGDLLNEMVEDVANSHDVDIKGAVNELNSILNREDTITEEKDSEDYPYFREYLSPDDYLIESALKNEHNFYLVKIWLKTDVENKELGVLEYLNEINNLGVLLDSYTYLDKRSEDVEGPEVVTLTLFSTAMQPDLALGVFDIPKEQIEEIQAKEINNYLQEVKSFKGEKPERLLPAREPQPVAVIEEEIEMEAVKLAKGNSIKAEETIRIPVSLLDDLMNLAGELVLSRNQLIRAIDNEDSDIKGLEKISQTINTITSDMQKQVMKTRLQPLSSILSKFNRIIRDLADKLSKEIQLKVSGEEVELDKSIIEGLSDPLTHIIRNCADHAIETPAEREAVGKAKHGTVQIKAAHVGGQVHIEIIDDGKGIDPDRIKNKAIEKGVVTVAEVASMSDRQIQNLIFAPGFSTASEVSDVSGRGVGMDVVRNNVEKLGGSVELESDVGQGTKICLKLPLTLAIIPAMVINAGQKRFAVPQINLEEIVQLSSERKVEMVKGEMVMRLRDKLLPLVDFHSLVRGEPADINNLHGSYVLVLKNESQRYGLIVEEIFDNEEIVVKPLSGYIKGVNYYSGSTIMGDGYVAMILDTSGIANEAQLSFREEKAEKTEDDHAEELANATEIQPMLLFNNHEEELFAVNLTMVSRLEKVKVSDIEKVGGREYIKYSDSSIRLIRLEDFMNVKKPEHEPEYVTVIIPKLVNNVLGIVATHVDDAIETDVVLDQTTINGTGVLGSFVLNKRLTVCLDVYSLFEQADPENFSWQKKQSKGIAGSKILLAEDTPFFRAVVSKYLKESDCEVDVAVHGQEALDMMYETEYDLLLTDIEMPIMNGIELARKVRSDSRFNDIPVIALSSLSMDKQLSMADKVDIDAFEVKLDKEHLRATMENILGGGRPQLVAQKT